jgi:N-acetylmuramoyl-L-alanine amidase
MAQNSVLFLQNIYKSMSSSFRAGILLLVFCETLLIPVVNAGPGYPNNKKWVIVIDPGHGGKDPGCHGKQYQEKTIALAVALKLGDYLEQDKDVKVIYTRHDDTFIPLDERAAIANRNHADLFICIHCNSSPESSYCGATTYVMGLNKTHGNMEVAKRENSSVLFEKDYKHTYSGFDPNSDEANILFSLYQNAYLEQSLDLSSKIQNRYTSLANRTDDGVKQAGFLVLWKTAMPSFLTEIGFLTNSKEERFLGSKKGQNKIALSIFYAFQEYKAEKSGIPFDSASFVINDVTPADDEQKETNTPKEVLVNDSVKPDTESMMSSTVTASIKKEVIIPPVKTTPAVKDGSGLNKPAHKMQDALKTLHIDSVKTPEQETPVQNTDLPPAQTSDAPKIYKVQFITSSLPLSQSSKKIEGVGDIDFYKDGNMYKYTAGKFSTLDEAVNLQSKLRKEGFKDAFIVAFRGSTRVAVKEK